MTKIKDIDVLLASYNGGKYIQDFLDSLLMQGDVKVNLIVGDDGSEDDTIQIIERFKENFSSFQLFHFNRVGAKSNFMKLLELSTSDFVAFADQDDVWERGRLQEAVEILSPIQAPCTIVSPLVNLKNGKKIKQENYGSPKNLMRNEIHGCSIVLNRKLVDLIKNTDPARIQMHDWWTILVANNFGMVITTSKKVVKYRLHKDNLIGLPKKHVKFLFFLNVILGKRSLKVLRDQANEIAMCGLASKRVSDMDKVNQWKIAVSGGFFTRVRYSIKALFRNELSVLDALKVSLGLY